MLPPEERAPVAHVDLRHPDFTDDALTAHKRLREMGPVVWLPYHKAFLLTRYDDVSRALRDPRLGEVRMKTQEKFSLHTGRDFRVSDKLVSFMPIDKQGETHAWQRRCLAVVLAPFALGGDVVERRVGLQIDRLRGLSRFDFVRDFSASLFFEVMADVVGLDGEERDLVRSVSGMSYALDLTLPLVLRSEFAERLTTAVAVLERRAEAAHSRGESGFLAALRDALPEERRSSEVVAYFVAICLLMGNDAAHACLAFPVKALLHDDHAGGRLPQRDWHLISDEAIRYATPIHFIPRVVVEDCEYRGVRMRAGERISLATLAADTDPARFGATAGCLDAKRDPDVGLAFGAGKHVCVGNRFARAVVRSAYRGLSKLPEIRSAGPAAMGRGSQIRRMVSLPVEYV